MLLKSKWILRFDKIWYITKNTYVYNSHIIGIFYEKSQYILDLHMSSLGTLVPEEPWCAFYATRHQVYWGLTHVDSCWYSNLLSHTQTHTHTHTHTHTAHSEASRLTHQYKYIFRPPAGCSQQLSFLHWMDNSLISKNNFP